MKLKPASLLPLGIIAVSLLTGGFYLAGIPSLFHTLLALVFLLFCPGMALLPLLKLRDLSLELPIGIALSLVLDTIVAAVALYLRAWHPHTVLAILIGMALVGSTIQLWQVHKVKALA